MTFLLIFRYIFSTFDKRSKWSMRELFFLLISLFSMFLRLLRHQSAGSILFWFQGISHNISWCQQISLNSRIWCLLSSDSRTLMKSGLSIKFKTTNLIRNSKLSTSGVIRKISVFEFLAFYNPKTQVRLNIRPLKIFKTLKTYFEYIPARP